MKKKITSAILAAVIIAGCFAAAFSAYGKTLSLTLNTKCSATIDGEDDRLWYTYTPDSSGIYSFMSYNTPASEGYLYIKEYNSETDTKEYKQLAYSRSDDNYEENGHNMLQFRLTYRLEAGVKYYFAAGWYSSSRTSGTYTVMLRSDSFDDDIQSISAECSAELNVYSDGEWQTDSNGLKYYYYSLSKIIANTTVTLIYDDGTTVSETGGEIVGGYSIKFLQDQAQTHWYPSANENYTSNTVTVQVLDKTAQLEITIATGDLYSIKCRVVDFSGNGIKNAVIKKDSGMSFTSDSDGYISFYSASGKTEFTVSAENSIDRDVTIVVSAVGSKNNFTDDAIELCNCDYVADGFINAKDYSVLNKLTDADEKENAEAQFEKSINFSASDYDELTLAS